MSSRAGRDEDDLAFLRDERDFRNVQLVEQPNGDFARHHRPAARLLRLPARAVRGAAEPPPTPTLAALAAKAVKEVDYHRDHADQWMLRLGDGTDESPRPHAGRRSTDVWPYVDELFDDRRRWSRAGCRRRRGRRRRPAARLAAPTSSAVLAEATLTGPTPTLARPRGGRSGMHTEPFGHMLAEMQHLHRTHPGASW